MVERPAETKDEIDSDTPASFARKRRIATALAAFAALGGCYCLMLTLNEGRLYITIESANASFVLLFFGAGTAVLIRISISRGLARDPRLRRPLRRIVLAIDLFVLLLFVSLLSAALFRVPVKLGDPDLGRGVTVSLQTPWILNIEIDYSHDTRHMLMHGAGGWRHWRLYFPIGLLLPIAVIFSYALFFDHAYTKFPWLQRRYPDGYCQSCGYDLRGSTSGICPECGASHKETIKGN
ncbi:MAG: hypothetical protein B6D36_18875 [Planctomycetes bacterium UTPLA1]|jgi:hypothetical protein|nr:MAG: hypothetical protein B6D36_18875 [Planctomycetes bacterium UTPLA1]